MVPITPPAELTALDEALWSLSIVEERTGFGATAIWEMEKRKEFPARRRVGKRAVAWLASEMVAWMRSRPPASETVLSKPPPARQVRPGKQQTA